MANAPRQEKRYNADSPRQRERSIAGLGRAESIVVDVVEQEHKPRQHWEHGASRRSNLAG